MNLGPELGKLPPQAMQLEQAVIGAAMLERGIVTDVNFLKPEHFYVQSHRRIWEVIQAIDGRGEPADILTVTHELKQRGELDIVGGPFYISQLTNKVASSANVQYHARIIVQEFVKREAIRIGSDTQRDGYDDTVDAFELAAHAEQQVREMIEQIAKKTSVRIGDVADEHLANMDKPAKELHSTGFAKLDKALGGGWSNGDLIIVAGRPGMGKTSAAFSMCHGSVMRGQPNALFSLELGEAKTNARLMSIGTDIPLARILERKDLTPEELTKIHEHHARYRELPLFVNFANGITDYELRSEIGRLVRRHEVGAVYIDQLTWVNPKEATKDRVGAITQSCKSAALEFDIPIILLHQLSRAVTARGGDKKPELTDLRDSGAAEQNAQVVIFPHRPEYYGISEDEHGSTYRRGDFIIAKNSNGPLDIVTLHFDAPCTSFRDTPIPESEASRPKKKKKDDEAKDETLPF